MRFSRGQNYGLFLLSFATLLFLHRTLLHLPYYWDEAGYYIPAAHDILYRGSLVPLTTVSNAHPPLVMLCLAAAWKVFGYSTLVTRSTMLAIAAFTLVGVYRLSERAANPIVALCTTALTAVYPVFFAQSSLAHVDLAAAGLTFWGLAAYLDNRPRGVAVWLCLAVLAKETALLTPALLGAWELTGCVFRSGSPVTANSIVPWRSSVTDRLWRKGGQSGGQKQAAQMMAALALPLAPLGLWYAYHFARTGYVLGNPEFVRYNITATMSLTRSVLALILRLWQVSGYLHLWLLTTAMAVAMLLRPLRDRGIERRRISIASQLALFLVVAGYTVAMSVIGGAVLARYMLTAVPLVILVAVSTIWRRLRLWWVVLLAAGFAFVSAWWWNPPYGFSPEDNLTYRDFITLHQHAAEYLEAHARGKRVLAAWPAADELTRPWLGYVDQPFAIVRVDNFTDQQLTSAAADTSNPFDYALVFSIKYDPSDAISRNWIRWQGLKERYFDFHRDVLPPVAAQILGGRIVMSENRNGMWIAVIAMDRVELAAAPDAAGATTRLRAQDLTGVCLDDQPHLVPGSQAQVIARGQRQMNLKRHPAVHNRLYHHVALLQ